MKYPTYPGYLLLPLPSIENPALSSYKHFLLKCLVEKDNWLLFLLNKSSLNAIFEDMILNLAYKNMIFNSIFKTFQFPISPAGLEMRSGSHSYILNTVLPLTSNGRLN